MGALQTAADAHYRDGDKPAALELLRKMAALDPSNTTSRLKVAELLRQEGMRDEALAEFERSPPSSSGRATAKSRSKCSSARSGRARPRGDAAGGRARAARGGRTREGRGAGAQAGSRRARRSGSARDIGTSLEGAGRDEEAVDVYRGLAEMFRARGEEDRARALMQRYGAADAFSVEDSEPPVLDSDGSDDLELDPDLDASLGRTELEAIPEPTARRLRKREQ